MLDHIGLYVSDFENGKAFFDAALAPLGYTKLKEFPEWSVAGYGKEAAMLWLSGREANHNVHIALLAPDKGAVDAFYAAALKAGGSDNGAPGYRTEYDAGYYAAFVIDPFGNNLEAVFHDPNPAPTEAAASR